MEIHIFLSINAKLLANELNLLYGIIGIMFTIGEFEYKIIKKI